jgi:16S rRNA (cytosine1402-N4)-methyltransferase
MARTVPGGLAAQVSDIFLAGRKRSLGTELLALFDTMVRTAPGWLSVRPSETSLAGRKRSLGTELLALFDTMVRTASGWLSVRPSETFLAGRKRSLGTELPALFDTMVRTAPGWLSVRPSADFTTDATAADTGDYHLPVFPAAVAEWMVAGPESFIIDGTLGGGGHSEIFLNTGARVLGIDRDPEALLHARSRLARFGERFDTWEGNFSQVLDVPAIQGGQRADGLLLDLGVSSRQLDSAARGFSFQREGPLDMRMGPASRCTAADIVNGWAEADLVRLLFEVGEEPKARRIAAAIIKRRAERPFATTTELANCIEKTTGRHGRIHPATRSFQAIRMAVNEELESLTAALAAAPAVLRPGGRLLVITFHSLEDRIVKHFLRRHSAPFIDDPGWPEPRPNPDCRFRLLARKAITPTAAETSLNPRSRSAKLRVAQLLE